ncbi:bifunctional DNA-formamidopyrimidine glycosylase/DNA-(apurinic or apyrimidinic site) lyase [Arthrobacter glacialis]|uniref:Formamidopyrimidine-DNA glycosylase n=1 Tax=Arthrobacter glacialis TaxID=1664 RepID=A0A2S3ZRX6_ARTGL|nr:bifunctional DNA-formamidopyrimidine glycosylase/DNA-(apurinic or apyrimidinic site) lyase [Arthrobacter glacialis]POH59741.1 bifunctional DNA-formamidopyrimidine glycosylase/DNA-(apurinic or apyrimidinic site) lyase [Arthrobacter glacialis]POH71960.1 bifunctional DNA-formamidopyrimidine glycosylase/DNA-(apurinic or apyrimidinic site) lyase [Arthrobacter glacialis]
MPELPEVEVVRRGLERWIAGRSITDVSVVDPRSIRRHSLGAEDFRGNLLGTTVLDVVRRGKFLWMPLTDDPSSSAAPHTALVAHLGMSGQLLVESPEQPHEKHLKVRLSFSPRADAPEELRFVDQRIFGGLFVTSLVPTPDGAPGGSGMAGVGAGDGWALIPGEAAHIGRDPLDPFFSIAELHKKLRARKTGLKRALLDQGLVSGIGNIYADEALWAARMHYARPTDTLRLPDTERIIHAAHDVMTRALDAGGTSFDSLYVNVNGASGYFSRSLNAYGREGEPCHRCVGLGLSTRIRRDTFMNRSSYSCPVCQPKPRNARL